MNKKSPAPYLKLPRKDSAIFTTEQNRLLDQITCEITTAWKDDLLTMRKAHKQALATSESIKNLTNDLGEQFPKIEEFLSHSDVLMRINTIEDAIKMVNYRQSEIAKTLLELEKKLAFENTKKMLKDLSDINEAIVLLKSEIIKLKDKPSFFGFFRKLFK